MGDNLRIFIVSGKLEEQTRHSNLKPKNKYDDLQIQYHRKNPPEQ